MKYNIIALRIFILTLSMNLAFFGHSQDDVTVALEQDIPEMRVDINFDRKYKRQLRLLRRTYPMALKAKELIDEYEADLADIDKKRLQKKYGRVAHAELKDQFLYNIRDLYRSEGDLLMELVHRETGMTVNEIIENYRGGFQQSMYSGLAKLWGNDLDATYNTEDHWITEMVIQDIESGKIGFDKEMRKMSRDEYKLSMEEYREKIKRMKLNNKKREKARKVEEKEAEKKRREEERAERKKRRK